MGLRVQGMGYRVQGLGSRAQNIPTRIQSGLYRVYSGYWGFEEILTKRIDMGPTTENQMKHEIEIRMLQVYLGPGAADYLLLAPLK